MYYINKVKGFYPQILVLNLQIIIITERLEIDIHATIDGASKCLCLAIWKFRSRRLRYFTADKSFVIN